MVGQVVSLGLFFFAQRAILSGLTTDQNGVLFLERRFADMVVLTLVDIGLNTTLLRLCSQFPERYQTWISNAIILRLSLWVIASICGLVYAMMLDYSLYNVAAWACYLLITSKSGLLRNTIEIHKRAEVQMASIVGTTILDALLFSILIYLWPSQLTPTNIITCYLLSAIPGFILTIFINRNVFNFSTIDFATCKMLVIQTLPLAVISVLSIVQERTDGLIFEFFSISAKEIGAYSAASTSISPAIIILPIMLSTALSPVIARLFTEDRRKAARYTETSLRYVFVISMFVVACSLGLSVLLIQVLTKNTYMEYLQYFQLYLLLSIPVYLLLVASDILSVTGATKQTLFSSVLIMIVSILSGLVLIPRFGGLGAIEAKILSSSIGTLFVLYTLAKRFETTVRFHKVLSAVLLLMIVVTCSVYLPRLMLWQTATLCAVIITGISAVVLRLVTMADVHLIRSMISYRFAK